MFSMLAHMGWEGDAGTDIMCGGEAFPASLRQVMQKCRSFSNVYGPTEALSLLSLTRSNPLSLHSNAPSSTVLTPF